MTKLKQLSANLIVGIFPLIPCYIFSLKHFRIVHNSVLRIQNIISPFLYNYVGKQLTPEIAFVFNILFKAVGKGVAVAFYIFKTYLHMIYHPALIKMVYINFLVVSLYRIIYMIRNRNKYEYTEPEEYIQPQMGLANNTSTTLVGSNNNGDGHRITDHVSGLKTCPTDRSTPSTSDGSATFSGNASSHPLSSSSTGEPLVLLPLPGTTPPPARPASNGSSQLLSGFREGVGPHVVVKMGPTPLIASLFGVWFYSITTLWLVWIWPPIFVSYCVDQLLGGRTSTLADLCGWIWARGVICSFACLPKVEGVENLPPRQDYRTFFMANHSSFFDIFIMLGFIPRTVRFISKIEIFRIPLLGLIMKMIGHVAIDRGNLRSQLHAFRQALDGFAEGVTFAAFPEETRSVDGRLGRLKPGLIRLAQRAGVRIVPTSLQNVYKAYPPQAAVPLGLPKNICMKFHSPIDVAGRAVVDIMRDVESAIKSGLPADQLPLRVVPPSPHASISPISTSKDGTSSTSSISNTVSAVGSCTTTTTSSTDSAATRLNSSSSSVKNSSSYTQGYTANSEATNGSEWKTSGPSTADTFSDMNASGTSSTTNDISEHYVPYTASTTPLATTNIRSAATTTTAAIASAISTSRAASGGSPCSSGSKVSAPSVSSSNEVERSSIPTGSPPPVSPSSSALSSLFVSFRPPFFRHRFSFSRRLSCFGSSRLVRQPPVNGSATTELLAASSPFSFNPKPSSLDEMEELQYIQQTRSGKVYHRGERMGVERSKRKRGIEREDDVCVSELKKTSLVRPGIRVDGTGTTSMWDAVGMFARGEKMAVDAAKGSLLQLHDEMQKDEKQGKLGDEPDEDVMSKIFHGNTSTFEEKEKLYKKINTMQAEENNENVYERKRMYEAKYDTVEDVRTGDAKLVNDFPENYRRPTVLPADDSILKKMLTKALEGQDKKLEMHGRGIMINGDAPKSSPKPNTIPVKRRTTARESEKNSENQKVFGKSWSSGGLPRRTDDDTDVEIHPADVDEEFLV